MRISYSWLQKYFETKLPEPQKLADIFTNHVFEVEGIEKAGDDSIFDFKVLPDRNHYLLCHRGVARELSVITGFALKLDEITEVPAAENSRITVKIENDKLCRRYVAREIDNLSVSAMSGWLRDMLVSLGYRSINNIVDAGNLTMVDVGQPFHIFDADKISGGITVRLARKDEKIIILGGAEIALNETDLVIADDAGPLAIAGVKGGARAEVNESTTRIIIESANFDPVSVRKTSTRLNLRNESSKRFENEITPDLAGRAMERITHLILQLCPGANAKKIIDVYPNPAKEWKVVFSPAYINSMIGIGISEEFMKSVLTRSGCRVETGGGDITITPPLERLDLIIPEDVADEVARIYGYDKLEGKLPAPLPEMLLPEKTFYYSEKIKNSLVERGYSEVILYSLVSKGAYEISYPLAEDKSALRENLSANLKNSLLSNGRNSDLLFLETVKLFEIGKIFPKAGEKTAFAIGVSQVKKKKGVKSEDILKADIELLRKDFNIPADYKIQTGEFGAVCEFDLDEIIDKLPVQGNLVDLKFAPLPKDRKYRKFSLYPFAVRDIAFFVNGAVSEKDAENIIVENAGPLCIQVRLFDVFEKEGRKSFAFRLIFQSEERTLVDEEIVAAMADVEKVLKEKFGAEIR